MKTVVRCRYSKNDEVLIVIEQDISEPDNLQNFLRREGNRMKRYRPEFDKIEITLLKSEDTP